MNIEIPLKVKILELFSEAFSFIYGAHEIPVVFSCSINKQKIDSCVLQEIKSVLYNLKYDLSFEIKENHIRMKVSFE